MKKLMLLGFLGFLVFVASCDDPINTKAFFMVNPLEAVVGSVINFDATGSEGPITSFEWDFGDGSNGTGQCVQHIYITAKIFTVKLTIRDSEGKTKTSTAQVDIYREGKKMTLTPMRINPSGSPELWIDAVYSQDPQTSTAWIAISEFGFDPSFITENHIFTLTLPELIEFSGNYVLTERAIQYQYDGVELIAYQHPTVIFKVFYCIGQAKSQFLLIELKMNNLGSGIIELKANKGISCYTANKFIVEAFSANIVITAIRFYD